MPFDVSVAYCAESAKYDSSAVTRLRRSDFMAAMYAFDLVLANFGIAIAARIPMITTTIRSSMRVKPRRVVRMFGLLIASGRAALGGRVRAYLEGGNCFVQPPECSSGARLCPL